MARTRRKVVDYIIVIFMSIVVLTEDMLQTVAGALTTKPVQGLLLAASFIFLQYAVIFGTSSVLISVVGAAALGILAAAAYMGWHYMHDPPVQTEHDVIEKIIPYNQWPDECYVCDNDIPDSMDYRGQFVIHKGDSDTETKAVPLCESCTWTYTTLLEYDDRFVEPLDCRGDPVEL